jgi:hypothetical protein
MAGGLVDFLRGPRAAMRGLAIAAGAALCAAIAVAFLGAAAFVVAFDRYGAVDACLGAALVFLILAVILGIIRSADMGRRRREARQTAASLAALSDPGVVLIGLQVAQAIGLKRLLPLLAIAGTAFAVVNAGPGPGPRRPRSARRRRPGASAGPLND